MNDLEVGWLAGILDGEGSFTAHQEKAKTKNGTVYINNRARIRCQMTDKDVIERLQQVTEAGTVSGPLKQHGLGTLPTWTWQVSRLGDVKRITDAIYSLMSLRRQAKIDEMRILKGWI
jgi:hypothetical protein